MQLNKSDILEGRKSQINWLSLGWANLRILHMSTLLMIQNMKLLPLRLTLNSEMSMRNMVCQFSILKLFQSDLIRPRIHSLQPCCT